MYALCFFNIYIHINVGSYTGIIIGISSSSSCGSISRVVIAYIYVMSLLHVVPVVSTCYCTLYHSYIS